MRQLLFMCLDAAVAAVIFVPIFWVLDRRFFHDGRRTVWYFLMAVYLSGMYAVVGLPDVRYIRLDLNINLVPFAYMFSDYRSSILNVLLFVPLGFFLPVLWGRYKKWYRTMFFGFCLSLLIELLQIFTYRATDVNDLMTNTFGTVLGWGVGRLALWVLPELRPKDEAQEVFAVCAVCFGVMFFVHPFLADAVASLIL